MEQRLQQLETEVKMLKDKLDHFLDSYVTDLQAQTRWIEKIESRWKFNKETRTILEDIIHNLHIPGYRYQPAKEVD